MREHPKRYFGMHMVPGVAEYRPKDQEMYRLLIKDDAIKSMNASFEGKPLFVQHNPSVPLEKLDDVADGWVVKSFFNPIDGKTWCEFMATSDEAHDAIRKGWTLSNCYDILETAGPGLHIGVEYDKEVMKGRGEHMALVPDPRYSESVVLTAEAFKEYNNSKELENKRLTNSLDGEIKNKKENGSMKFFTRTKVENTLDIEQTMVTLDKSKKDMTIANALEIADKVMNLAGYADPQHMVKIGNEDMSVGDLAEAYNGMLKAKNEEDEKEEDCMNESEDEKEGKKKENESETAGSKALVKEDAKATNSKDKEDSHFTRLKNAEMVQNAMLGINIEVSQDKVARGKQRYGSEK